MSPQIVIEPFFDSMRVMSNLVFETSPGQVLDSAKFASQFPITADQSVIPTGAENPQSGAEFNDPSVDILPPNTKLALLPPEDLPPLEFHETISAPLPTEAFLLPTLPPPEPQSKILHIEKDATVADGTANSTSDVINYTLAVTNTGNAAIANVVVDDPFTTNEAPVLDGGFNAGDTDQDNLLDVGETWQYTASHHGDAGRAGRRDSHRQHGDGDRHRGDPGHATTPRFRLRRARSCTSRRTRR